MFILISLLILVHEFGHFLAAKAIGVRVDKFGFGLPVGPTLFKKKFGDTEIYIHAFLLGGYVSFPDDEEDCDLPKDSNLRFCNKTVGQRIFVITAGVIFNVIFAYYLIFSAGMIWKILPENKFNVYFDDYTEAATEATKQSGLKKGDKIIEINGTEIIYPVAVNKFFIASKEFDGFAAENIINEKVEQLKKLNPNLSEQNVIPAETDIILPEFTDEEPVKLSLANITGIEKYEPKEVSLNDTQKELRNDINYQTTYKTKNEVTLYDIAAAVSDTKKPLKISVLRLIHPEENGDEEHISLPTLYSNKDGCLGIKQYYDERLTEIHNVRDLTAATFAYVNENVGFMAYTLGKLFTGKVPVSEMNGIIAITKIGTEIIAYQGIFRGILLTAMISLNLAIINILPIPALDGGHLLFLVIEKITGRAPSKKFVEVLNNLFFYLLVAFMVLIIYNDIHAWIIGKI